MGRAPSGSVDRVATPLKRNETVWTHTSMIGERESRGLKVDKVQRILGCSHRRLHSIPDPDLPGSGVPELYQLAGIDCTDAAICLGAGFFWNIKQRTPSLLEEFVNQWP
jgi:hypothetical protein